MKKLLIALMLLFIASGYTHAAGTLYVSDFEDGSTNMGGSSSTRSINSTTTYIRTGKRSQKIAVTNASNGWGYGRVSLTYTKNTYIHIIAWVYSSINTRFYLRANGNGTTPDANNLTASTWTRFDYSLNYTSSTGSKNTDFQVYRGNGACDYYLDDVIVYEDNTSATDLTAPTSASSASATTSSISWTNGTDAATGVQNTLIFRRTSGSDDDLTLNNQGNYSSTNYRANTDQTGHWTLVSNSIASDATSYSGTFSEGDRYAIVHRDLAYNYSTPTYVTIESGGGCTSYSVTAATSTGTDTYGTVSSNKSSLCEDGTATITAVPASGYRVKSWAVTGTDASISPSGTSSSTTTTLTMGTADATVTVTFEAIPSYTVTHTLSNVSKTSGGTSATEGTNYTAVYSTGVGYALPSTITVTIGGVTATAGDDYTWTQGTGTLTIYGASVTDDIEVTITGVVSCTSITPSLSYSEVGGTTLTVGDVSTGAPTVSGNTGSGAVTYSVTAASPAGCATVNRSTGVVSAVAVGTATITASIAANGGYCANTATANFTIECVSPGLSISLKP